VGVTQNLCGGAWSGGEWIPATGREGGREGGGGGGLTQAANPRSEEARQVPLPTSTTEERPGDCHPT
jgi:hypothetical protein